MALELAVSVGALAFKAYSFAQSLEADAAEVSVQYELIARRLERLMHLLGPLKAIYETGDDSVQVACLHMREDLMACLLHAAQLQSLIDTKSVLKKASASNVDAGALLQRLSTTVSDLTLLLSVSVLRQVGEPKVDPKAPSESAAPEPVHAVSNAGPEPPAPTAVVPAKQRKFEDPYDKPVLMLAAAVLKRMDQNLYSEKGALAGQGASNPFPSLGAFVKSVKDLSSEMKFVKRSSGNFMYLEPVLPGEPFCLGTEAGFVDTNFRVSPKAIQQAAVYRFEAAEYRSGEALFYLVTETAEGKRYVGYENDSLPGLNKLFRKMAVPFMETVKSREFAFLFKLPLKISAAVTLPFSKREESKAADGSTGAAPGSDVAAGLVGSGFTTTTRVYFTLQRLDQGGLTLSVTRADKDDGEFHALATLFNQSSVAVFVQRFELYLPPSAPAPPASQVGEGLKQLLQAQTSSLTLVKKAFEAFKDPITSAANDFIHTVDL